MNESSIAPPVRKQKPNAQQCSYIYDRDLPLYTSCLSTPFASLKKKSQRVFNFLVPFSRSFPNPNTTGVNQASSPDEPALKT